MTAATATKSEFGVALVAPLALGSLLNPINSSMIATALGPIGRAFNVGISETVVLVAALYVTSAVAQPTMGKLADRWGARRVFLFGLVVVMIGGIAGALARSFEMLIAVRVILGVGTSAAYPSAMRVLRLHAKKVGKETPRPVLGVLSLAALSSAAIGPTLGGFLTGAAGWRSVFLVNVPLALIGIVLCLLFVETDERDSKAKATPIDVTGILLFSAAIVVAMLFGMSLKKSPRWWLLPIALAFLGVLIAHSRRKSVAEPFIDVRMLRANLPLSATYLRFAATCVLCYVMFYGFAQWMQDSLHFSATEAGIATLPLSISAAVASLLGARTKTIRGPLAIAAVALLVGYAGLLLLGDHSSRLMIGIVGLAFGLAQGTSSVGNQAAVYEQAPADQIGTASGLQRTAGYLGAVVASSLIAFFYGVKATSAGLHSMAIAMAVLAALLCAGTLLDPSLSITKKPAK